MEPGRFSKHQESMSSIIVHFLIRLFVSHIFPNIQHPLEKKNSFQYPFGDGFSHTGAVFQSTDKTKIERLYNCKSFKNIFLEIRRYLSLQKEQEVQREHSFRSKRVHFILQSSVKQVLFQSRFMEHTHRKIKIRGGSTKA